MIRADMYNRQLDPYGKEEALARKLAGLSNGQYTVQQMADMLRLAGIKGSSITPGSVATVNVANAGAVYDNPSAGDSGSQFMYDGKSTIGTQALPAANADAIQFIISQTGGKNSPYYWSTADTTPAPVYSSTPTDYGSQIGPYGAGYFSCASTDCLVYNANVDPKNPGTQAMYQSEDTALLVGGTALTGAAGLVAPEVGIAIAAANGGMRTYSGAAGAAVNTASQGIQIAFNPSKEFDFVDVGNAFVTNYATYGMGAASTVLTSIGTTAGSDFLVKPAVTGSNPSSAAAATDLASNALTAYLGFRAGDPLPTTLNPLAAGSVTEIGNWLINYVTSPAQPKNSEERK